MRLGKEIERLRQRVHNLSIENEKWKSADRDFWGHE